jgi:uncharacterized protein
MIVTETGLDTNEVPARDGATPGQSWAPWQAVLAAFLIVATGALTAVGVLSVMRMTLPVEVMKDGILALLCGMLTAQAVMVILTVLMMRRRRGDPLQALSLNRPAGGVAVYAGYFAVMIAVIVAYNALLIVAWGHDPLTDLKAFSPMIKSPWWPLALLAIGLGAPLSEEVLFRGYLLPGLARSRIRFWGAAIVTSGLWTLLHAGYSAAGIAEVFMIGLLFSVMLQRTGSLRVPLVCHAVYNTTLALLVKFYPVAL